jgi:DNA-binding FadR family transcriptional regulator
MPKSARNYQVIAGRIEQLIRSKYEAGDKLPGERDLAKRFHSNRPAVREAVVSLEIAGLVEVRTNSGIYVLDKPNGAQSPDQGPPPFEILRARIVVEPEVAALAARNATAADFEEMEYGIQRMREEHEQNNPTEQGDRVFHLGIAGGCGNAMLARIVELLWDNQQKSSLWLRADGYSRSAEFRESWIIDHLDVLEAIRQRKADAARAAMAQHLDHTWRALLAAGPD